MPYGVNTARFSQHGAQVLLACTECGEETRDPEPTFTQCWQIVFTPVNTGKVQLSVYLHWGQHLNWGRFVAKLLLKLI